MTQTKSSVMLLAGFLVLAVAPGPTWGRQEQTQAPTQARPPDSDPASDALEANPNRPSSSNSADVLDPGVLQVEYGFSREWDPGTERQSAVGGELRFGIWKNIEIRWGGSSFVRDATVVGAAQGFGDQYLSGQIRLKSESKKRPAMAVSYAINLPAGNSAEGLGSGSVDHFWTFLASKDVHGFTCDFNAEYQLAGRPGITGHEPSGVFILALQRTVYGPLSAIAEIGGETRSDARDPSFATALWAFTYKVHRQVVLDAAMDVGITNGAPHKRILFGITYAIANLYPKRQAN